MTTIEHVTGWLLVAAVVVSLPVCTYLYLAARRRERRGAAAARHAVRPSARTRVQGAARWLRWIGPRVLLRLTSHEQVQRVKHRFLAATASTDLTAEPPDDWSPAAEYGESDRPFRTNLDRPTHPPMWQPAKPRDVAFPGWGTALNAAIATAKVPSPLRNGGWNPNVPDTTWNRGDQRDLNARLDWDRMLRDARDAGADRAIAPLAALTRGTS